MRVTVRYDMAGSDGLTRRQRNINFGVHPGPEVEPPLAHVWTWFWHLSSRRQPAMSGTSPISYTEIAEWQRLTGEIVTRDEIKMLIEMDQAFRAACADESSGKTDTPKDAPVKKVFKGVS